MASSWGWDVASGGDSAQSRPVKRQRVFHQGCSPPRSNEPLIQAVFGDPSTTFGFVFPHPRAQAGSPTSSRRCTSSPSRSQWSGLVPRAVPHPPWGGWGVGVSLGVPIRFEPRSVGGYGLSQTEWAPLTFSASAFVAARPSGSQRFLAHAGSWADVRARGRRDVGCRPSSRGRAPGALACVPQRRLRDGPPRPRAPTRGGPYL